mgnify:FL=1|jgi:hypothetical protein
MFLKIINKNLFYVEIMLKKNSTLGVEFETM